MIAIILESCLGVVNVIDLKKRSLVVEVMCLALLVFRDQASCELLKDSWLKYA